MSRTPRVFKSVRTCIQNLGALTVLEPHPEHLTLAVERNRQREVAGFALHRAAVAGLEHECVEEDDRIDVIKRPGLPGPGVVHDRVCHPADQVAPDLDPVDLFQVRLDVAGRQAAAFQGEDLVVEALEPPLPLPHDLRLERPLPIARRLDSHLSVLGDQRLRRRPIPSVAGPTRRLLVRFVAEMVGPLHPRGDKDPARTTCRRPCSLVAPPSAVPILADTRQSGVIGMWTI
jgi:hypothetical protein